MTGGGFGGETVFFSIAVVVDRSTAELAELGF